MLKNTSLLFFCLIASFSSLSQANQNNNSIRAKCAGPVFSLCEQMPTLSNDILHLGDSLKIYLEKSKIYIGKGFAKFQLTILRSGEIENIALLSTDIENKNAIDMLANAIKEMTNPWIPGKQNGYLVCCFRKLQLSFSDNKIEISFPKF